MANIRREFGDDLSFKNGNLGINTTTTQERVDVVGVVKGRDLNVTGVTSLTAYEGFLRADNQIVEETNLEFGNGLKASLSGEIIVGTGVTVTIGAVGLGTTSVGVGTHTIQNNIETTDINLAGGSQIECLKVYNTFTPPSGGTNERPYAPKPGELYYNYDFKTIEFFDGYGWRQVDNTTRSGRAVFGGGNYAPGESSTYDYLIMSTLGNTVNFGEITLARANPGACGDGVRAVFAGGEAPSSNDTIDYNSIPSGGVGADFGNLTSNFRYMAGCSSSTRGIFFSGSTPSASDAIEYIEIQTTGNSLDFGNLIGNGILNHGACSSPVRGISMDGAVGGDQQIQYVTIASKGNAVSFGQGLYTGGSGNGDAIRSCSNDITGLGAGAGATNIIAYITMATTGNALDFGDLTRGRYGIGATASKIRGIFNSGWSPSISPDSVIDYVTFASKGNAIDFGDSSDPRRELGATSDSHGGLGGF